MTYILPIRRVVPMDSPEFEAYVRWLDRRLELIIVDGSPPNVFEKHAKSWLGLQHTPPSPGIQALNGKVHGVLTGLRKTAAPIVIIADDDVRYDEETLFQVRRRLEVADIVRPQNYFSPAPWHALLDTARILLNRVSGGDWPGTLVLRRDALPHARGYNGDCLFENLELVRTVKAHGGAEHVAFDVFVRRLPPSTGHFLLQRVRQAYDEFARPMRLVAQLSLLPLTLVAFLKRPGVLLLGALVSIAAAEAGRRRAGGTSVFPAAAALWAPLWLLERAICSWAALYYRLARGGMPYSGRTLRRAASSPKELAAAARSRAEALTS